MWWVLSSWKLRNFRTAWIKSGPHNLRRCIFYNFLTQHNEAGICQSAPIVLPTSHSMLSESCYWEFQCLFNFAARAWYQIKKSLCLRSCWTPQTPPSPHSSPNCSNEFQSVQTETENPSGISEKSQRCSSQARYFRQKKGKLTCSWPGVRVCHERWFLPLQQANEDISKTLLAMKTILYGDGGS